VPRRRRSPWPAGRMAARSSATWATPAPLATLCTSRRSPSPRAQPPAKNRVDLASDPHLLCPDEATVVLDDDWWLNSEEVAAFPAEVARHLSEHRRRPVTRSALLAPPVAEAWRTVRRLFCSAAQIRCYQVSSRTGRAPISATSGSWRETTSCHS
jgi:hypothetical protein